MKDKVDLLKAVGGFFFEKIQANPAFRNDRVGEWNAKMPVPPLINPEENDQKIKFASLHRHLSSLDNKFSTIGEAWVDDDIEEFSSVLSDMIEIYERGKLNEVNKHVIEYNRGVLQRASGSYEQSIEHFRSAESILQDYI